MSSWILCHIFELDFICDRGLSACPAAVISLWCAVAAATTHHTRPHLTALTQPAVCVCACVRAWASVPAAAHPKRGESKERISI